MITADTPITPRQESFVAEFLSNGERGDEAVVAVGYARSNARPQASRLLAQANIRQLIDRKRAVLAVRTDYTVALWLQDLRRRIDLAEQSGSWSAVFKGMELVGRNIGALTDSGRLSADEANLFAWLGAAASRAGWEPVTGARDQLAAKGNQLAAVEEPAVASARVERTGAREAGEGGDTR